MTLSLNAWKGLSMATFTLISVIGATIAVLLKEKAKQVYISCGVIFSSGVLLAGGFVHLLPDADAQFSEVGAEFPWAFCVSGSTIVGLACIEIILDRVIEDYITKSNNTYATVATDDTLDGQIENGEAMDLAPLVPIEHDHDHGHDHRHVHSADPNNPFSAILLTIALSIHSIIEGLGIGASGDISAIQSAFIAVVAHKGFTAFALAEGLVSSGYWKNHSRRKYFYISIGTFIMMNLIGIAIGWGVSSSGEENTLTAVLISITAGSFIYVSVVEILPQETKNIKSARLPIIPIFISFIAGFSLMSMLALYA